MPPRLHAHATARNSYQMSLYKWHSSWYRANANRHDIAARLMTFSARVSFHSEPGVRSCSASCSHRVHENLLKRILSLSFYPWSSVSIGGKNDRSKTSLKIILRKLIFEKEIRIDLSRRRKKEWSVANNEIRCHSMLVTLHESEGIFDTGATCWKPVASSKLAKVKEPLVFFCYTLSRITITVTRAKGASNPFSFVSFHS